MQKWELQPARDQGLPPADRWRSLQRESGLFSTGLRLVWWSLIRGYLATWHRLTITGRQHLPAQPPFVLVANHSSHLDALVLASPLSWRLRDRIFPVAAGDVFFQTPLTSAFAAGLLNALPMWRKKCGPHALEQLRHRLVNEPCAYILFPEGTRSRNGQMAGFKPGLGMLVAETDVPIVPCYLEGCFQALTPEQHWPRPRQICMRIGEPLICKDLPNKREGWLKIASELESRVKALAAPI